MSDGQYRNADSHTTVQIQAPTRHRIAHHAHESETVAATIDRALDALAFEQSLPDAVVAKLPPVTRVDGSVEDAEGSNYRIANATHERLQATDTSQGTHDAAINRALDALARHDAVPEAVEEVLREDA